MPEFLFIADQLWLDFVNTELAPKERPRELLTSPAELALWLEEAGLCATSYQKRAVQELKRDGAETLRRALAFRSALRAMVKENAGEFRKTRRGQLAIDRAVRVINAVLEEARVLRTLERDGAGLVLRETWESSPGLGLLAPVAESAARFLVSGKFDRVLKCGNPACILYVYDTTRSHTRQWCRMEVCGNRMKVAAFQRRKKAEK